MGYFCLDDPSRPDPSRPGWRDPTRPDPSRLARPDIRRCRQSGLRRCIAVAARQALTPTSRGQQVRIHQVRNHRNAVCGSQTVAIRNWATAGPHNYTPSVPYAAAMNNLAGVGDGCSAHGNRNFWRSYCTWFGPTATPPHGRHHRRWGARQDHDGRRRPDVAPGWRCCGCRPRPCEAAHHLVGHGPLSSRQATSIRMVAMVCRASRERTSLPTRSTRAARLARASRSDSTSGTSAMWPRPAISMATTTWSCRHDRWVMVSVIVLI